MAPTTRPFVGRDRELEELASGLDEAAKGHGALFVTVGVAGIGKTRMADEAARAAEARGFRAIWGRCWETGGAPAYWPWMQITRELARGEEGRANLTAIGPSTARLLGPLVADATDGPGAPAPDSDPAQARFRLFDATVSLLRVAAERTPLAIVLDDLHAADPSSLALLRFVARNLRGLRALVLGTYRDEEARLAPDIGRMLAEIAREGAYLPLRPLGRGEIAALVANATGRDAEDNLVDLVERTSEGNPLFLGELLRLLAAQGDLGQVGRAGARLPLPDTAKEVIGHRIARLAEPVRVALGCASVVGREFATDAAAAASRLDATTLERHLAEAERAGLVTAPAAGRWRFSHVLLREVLYRGLDRNRRAEGHLAVAVALEASPQRDEVIAETAHHRLSALPLGEANAAAESARRAAARAMALLAFEDAASLLERAHAALARLPPPRDEGAICRADLARGSGADARGDLERGRRSCLDVADQARRLGAGDLLARAALGYGAELILAITDTKLVGLLEEALTVLPNPSGLRAQCLARLAAARQPAPDPTAPLVLARKAVAMARQLGDDEVLRPVLAAAGSALADYAPPAERAAVSEELARLATIAGDRVLVLRAQARLVIDYLEMGAIDRSARALDAYEALAREFRQARHLWPGRLMRAMLASATGRFDEADRLAEEARALAPDDPMLPVTNGWRCVAHALLSDRDTDLLLAERALPALLEVKIFGPWAEDFVNLTLAALRARWGDRDAVRRHLGAVPATSHFYHYEYSIMTAIAEAIVLAGDQTLAALVYDRLAPSQRPIATGGRIGLSCWGSVDGARGLLAVFLGRRDQAAAHFAAALTASAGLKPLLAPVQCWYSEFLRNGADPGDRIRAEALASEALVNADELGLSRLRTRLTRPLTEQGPPAPAAEKPPDAIAAAPTHGPKFVMTREGDYWTVEAAGEICRIKDGRGIQMLAELCKHPGREFHVLALMGATGDAAADIGDAGVLLDEEAIAEYRGRVADLDEEMAEAQQWADLGRVERLRSERDVIAGELARGVGLGGRARRAGSAAERARTNVQRRIRRTIQKIGETLPAVATYLDRAVTTGTFCSYEPF